MQNMYNANLHYVKNKAEFANIYVLQMLLTLKLCKFAHYFNLYEVKYKKQQAE